MLLLVTVTITAVEVPGMNKGPEVTQNGCCWGTLSKMQWHVRNRLMWGKQKISLERGDSAPSFQPLMCVVLHREDTHVHSKNPQVPFVDCAPDYPGSAASFALSWLEA